MTLDQISKYPPEELGPDDDDGTMEENVATLAASVVGHRIVRVEEASWPGRWATERGLRIVLDDGRKVQLANTSDCCAYTELGSFLLHADRIDNIITGVGTTDRFTTWHVYADMGDVLELSVGWSCGNPFYYGYGFDIEVVDDLVDVTAHTPEIGASS